ncbi:MAG: enoyl-CoA hydratase/isomerase family protein [Betaproteobacteria bacterium]|nr:enoyl-CoA hydratase/isomerase family protein [Betaproteobacteria bacterium]MDE2046996.1 enoyl-CoA hydratase/isomerase family protein [Betaproteobacteria bacterium]
MNTLTLSIARGVATVTLARPAVRNAFNAQVIAELTEVFAGFPANKEVRVVILQAEGKAFCAGADLNWMQQMAGFTHDENVADAAALARMLHTLYTCSQPVIARVQGDVFAGGVGLVAACDIAVSVQSARWCLSEVKLGLIPATIAPYVIRAMGARAAHRYFLTAEVFDTAEAQRIGLLHEVTQGEAQLDAAVQRYAQQFLAASPHALAQCKRLLHDVAHAPLSDALRADTAQRIADIRVSEQGREGVAAFLERRTPAWLQLPDSEA